MTPQHKALKGLKITDATKGEVEAVFAEFDVVDHDGDVTLKGAFTEEDVRISAYNHKSWEGALPVGKGVIYEEGNVAVFKGQFFLNTTAGKDTFEVVKQMGDLQEWSYGYDTLESEPGTKDGQSVNFIKRQKVHEVSPVILGAGKNTHTRSVKGAKQLASDLETEIWEAGKERFGGSTGTYVWVSDFEVDADWVVFGIETAGGSGQSGWRYVRIGYVRNQDGSVSLTGEETEVERTTTYVPAGGEKSLKLKEHVAAVLTSVDALTTRTADVVTLRSDQGKSLGSESQDLLAELETRLERLKGVLTPQPADDNDTAEAARREFLRAEKRRFEEQGDAS